MKDRVHVSHVDRDEGFTFLLQVALDSLPLSINLTRYTDPHIALVRLKALSTSPDLIILDYYLNGKNGFDFLREIRAAKALAKTKVVFLTTAPDTAFPNMARELGAVGFFQKPFGLAGWFSLAKELLAVLKPSAN